MKHDICLFMKLFMGKRAYTYDFLINAKTSCFRLNAFESDKMSASIPFYGNVVIIFQSKESPPKGSVYNK